MRAANLPAVGGHVCLPAACPNCTPAGINHVLRIHDSHQPSGQAGLMKLAKLGMQHPQQLLVVNDDDVAPPRAPMACQLSWELGLIHFLHVQYPVLEGCEQAHQTVL